jgi:hypothetical protein
MAANLSGMFAQLNQVIQGNPLATGVGDAMVDRTSQAAGGLMAALPGQSDPYSFMTQGAKQRQGPQDMAGLDMSSIEGLKQAAEVAGKMGDTAMQAQLAKRAADMEAAEMQRAAEAAKAEAEKAAAQAKLDQTAAKETAAAQETKAQRSAAAALATRDGNTDLAESLRTGAISPEAYFQTRKDANDLYELSANEMLVDKDGNIIRLNPGVTKGGVAGSRTNYASEVKLWNELDSQGNESLVYSDKMAKLASELEQQGDYDAGLFATVEDFILTQLGQRDNEQYLRTRVKGILNHEAISMLPPGPASDRDVAIVREGVPPANASKEEVLAFIRANERIARYQAEYDKMKADFIIRKDPAGFQAAWDQKIAKDAKQEWIDSTPSGAIQYLQNNPSQEMRDAFLAKYKWLPEGL